MICPEDGCLNDVHPDYDTCYKHAKMGIGITFRAAQYGRSAWHTSIRDHHEQHLGVSDGKELAKTRPEIDRYTGSAPSVDGHKGVSL